MADAVFILGAGASKECGAPLMADFLDVADELRLRGKAGTDVEHFERVFESIAALKSVQAQMALDTYDLEKVFSAFEMGAMIGRLGSINEPARIMETRRAMTRVIARTLQATVRLRFSNNQLAPAPSYSRFVELLVKARNPAEVKRPIRPAIITLNYDLALDFALHWHQVAYSYGLSEGAPNARAIPLLKLHGSLNWGSCPKCESYVASYDLGAYFKNYTFRPGFDDRPIEVELDLGDRLQDLRHEECRTTFPNEPLVVPPTWNKSDNRLLRNVWRLAAHALSEARYLVFIGYSFPETDLYFQYLLGLGLAGDTRIRRIVVINPDSVAHDRLQTQLSPVMRKRVVHLQGGFGHSLGDLEDLLELESVQGA
ncbi:SIR2 family protein [Anaeromyxobacter terrae]|uniref:SIR2 family protein n=1 Tax=Anaeromyxobacter terrae TaxID=2925406 RepID=UPI001F56849B|nr:SIR2 family protein [Anaeromyxobacter sp. SG22]